MTSVLLTALQDIPDIAQGDDLATIIAHSLRAQGLGLQEGDILCVAQKIFSKAEGCITLIESVTASAEAERLGAELGKDPRKIEVILRESSRIIRAKKRPTQREGVLICEHRLGFISANAAVDESNLGVEGGLMTLPPDPDASCRTLAVALSRIFGCALGVVMTDTFGRPWRLGQVNVAIGLANVPATLHEQGNDDAWGRKLHVTEPALADEIAAASGLVVRKNAKTPVVLLRGLEWKPLAQTSYRDTLRPHAEDMFR